MEHEQDRERRPKHRFAMPIPHDVNPNAKIEKSEVDSLYEPIVFAQSLTKRWEPTFLRHNRGAEQETYQDSHEDGMGRYFLHAEIPPQFSHTWVGRVQMLEYVLAYITFHPLAGKRRDILTSNS